MRTLFCVASLMMVAACGSEPGENEASSTQPVAEPTPTCENIRDQVVEASSDADVKILKIYDPETVASSETLLSCKGSAMISSGDERQTVYYKVETDEEGDSFVGYSPDPYPAPK